MWRRDDRGQSESLGSLLLVAVFLVSATAVGAYTVPSVLDQQQPDGPLADIEIEAVDGEAVLVHAGGEPLDTASVDIVTRNGGEQRGSIEDRTVETLESQFRPGERATLDGGVGETTVIVIDTADNAVVAEETLQLPSGFQVAILDLDSGAVGEDLTVEYSVQNVDIEADTQDITLTIEDADGNTLIDDVVADDLQLDADEGTTEIESYEITDGYVPTAEVTVATDDDAATETVSIEDSPDPTGSVTVESPIFDGQDEFEVAYEFEHLESAFLRVENEAGDEFELNVDDPDGSGTENIDADDVPIADETITATLSEADGGAELATDATTVSAAGALTVQPDIHAGMDSFDIALDTGTDGWLVVTHDGSEYETAADSDETVTVAAADVGGLTAGDDVSATFYESDDRDVALASDSTEVREPERPSFSDLSVSDDSFFALIVFREGYTVDYAVADPDDQFESVEVDFEKEGSAQSRSSGAPTDSLEYRDWYSYGSDYEITISLYDQQGEVESERVVIEDTADGDDPEIPE